MNSQVTLSVVVPIYNMEQRLHTCLSSLKKVSMPDVEFLLINDGSTDNSEEICEEYVAADERFLYVYKDNGGVSTARNIGYKRAQGEYITYVDSDDSIIPESWSKMLVLMKELQVDILNFGYTYVQDEKRDDRSSLLPKGRRLDHSDVKNLLTRNLGASSFLWFPWSNFFRKELLDKHQIVYKEDIKAGMEDTLFILECYCYAESLYSVSDSCYNYVHYSESLSQKRHKAGLLNHVNKQFEERLRIYKQFNLTTKPYLLNLARHYMEHTFFAGLRNLKYAVGKDFVEGLKEMRETYVYSESLKHYKSSTGCPIKKRLYIFLFNNRQYSLLKRLYP